MTDSDPQPTSEYKELLNIINQAHTEHLASAVLISEFPQNPELAIPHLSKVWSSLDLVESKLSSSPSNYPSIKFDKIHRQIAEARKYFADLNSEYSQSESATLNKIIQKIDQHQMHLSKIIQATETNLKLLSGWKPWYLRKSTYLIIALILALFISLAIQNRVKNSRQGFTIVSSNQSWGHLKIDKSVESNKLSVSGKKCKNGLGTHANSEIVIKVKEGRSTLQGICGLDDENAARNGSIQCSITQNDKVLFESAILKGDSRSEQFKVKIDPNQLIKLKVSDANDGRTHDHADWCDIRTS